MWKFLIFVTAYVLLSFIIDGTFSNPSHLSGHPAPHSRSRPGSPTGSHHDDIQKPVQSVTQFCHILNFDALKTRDNKEETLHDPNDPIKKYFVGPSHRVEYVLAVVTAKHIKERGTGTNQNVRDHTHDLGEANDDAGHIIANALGGSGTKVHNIFPQNLSMNRGKWKGVEKKIRELALASNDDIELVFQFNYEGAATRPNWFRVRVRGHHFCNAYDISNPVKPAG